MKPLDERQSREVLEVAPEASLEEITDAYELLKRIHGKDFMVLGGSALEEFSLEARAVALEDIEAAYRLLRGLGGEAQERPLPEPVPAEPEPVIEAELVLPSLVPEEPALPPAADTVLGRARQAAGLSLDEVVAETHVPRGYLEALEEERLEALPEATVMVRGFLTAFVNAVGLRAEDVVPGYMAKVLDRQSRQGAEASPKGKSLKFFS